jgi:hypothetical protein
MTVGWNSKCEEAIRKGSWADPSEENSTDFTLGLEVSCKEFFGRSVQTIGEKRYCPGWKKFSRGFSPPIGLSRFKASKRSTMERRAARMKSPPW